MIYLLSKIIFHEIYPASKRVIYLLPKFILNEIHLSWSRLIFLLLKTQFNLIRFCDNYILNPINPALGWIIYLLLIWSIYLKIFDKSQWNSLDLRLVTNSLCRLPILYSGDCIIYNCVWFNLCTYVFCISSLIRIVIVIITITVVVTLAITIFIIVTIIIVYTSVINKNICSYLIMILKLISDFINST